MRYRFRLSSRTSRYAHTPHTTKPTTSATFGATNNNTTKPAITAATAHQLSNMGTAA